jgi:hypothetical protein
VAAESQSGLVGGDSAAVFSNLRMSLKGELRRAASGVSFWGLFHICFVVAVAVGMWESALSISKVCGKGGKQFYRFPGFP